MSVTIEFDYGDTVEDIDAVDFNVAYSNGIMCVETIGADKKTVAVHNGVKSVYANTEAPKVRLDVAEANKLLHALTQLKNGEYTDIDVHIKALTDKMPWLTAKS